jgi:hypothetical protein
MASQEEFDDNDNPCITLIITSNEAQRLLKLDIKAGKHTGMGKTDLHESNIEYYKNSPICIP